MAEPDFASLWKAFKSKDRDRVIVGVAAAFALVTVADGSIDPSETQRFLDVVRGSRLAPTDPVTSEQLSRAFHDVTRAMLERPDLGRSEALRVLADFGFDPMRSEIIWSATSAALVADAALDSAEQSVAREIRTALRIRSGQR